MLVEKGTVRPPEIGRVWFNSNPLSMRQLLGQVVLIDFWDYTCVNCIRTLPYVQAWHERYKDKGLAVIGVHTPEFTFAQYESNVERGIRDFGLTYPNVIDSDYELWKAFANRYWPTKYLVDKDGYLRYAHFGEGQYEETERTIQELLRERHPNMQLPPLMAPVRDEDRPGAVCLRASSELYLGHARGRIGNESGFHEDLVADYDFRAEDLKEEHFYARGRWSSTREYFGSEGDDCRIFLKYEAAGVNLVMAARKDIDGTVEIRQDGLSLTPANATKDTQFRDGLSVIHIEKPRMYSLVDNHAFGTHTLEIIIRTPGVALFAFTFTSCVAP
jgi:thiol-disulfide isomerase/thioredoxin